MCDSESERGKTAGRKDGPAKESFRKGNVNFDLLQPTRRGPVDEAFATGDYLPGQETGKRGLFFKNREPRPLRIQMVVYWAVLFLGSTATLVWSFAFGRSIVWLMLFPVVILAMLWSAIMLAVIFARPR